MSTRLKITLAYHGKNFSGWQIQANAKRTVQAELEAALTQVCGVPVRPHGAGRTDAGVHALGQVAHADVPDHKAHTAAHTVDWVKALNATTPPDIAITEAGVAPEGFHAQRSAVAKTYTYRLWTEPRYVLPQRRHHVWACGPLNLDAMIEAATHLVGTRDFAACMNTGTPVRSTVRTVSELTLAPAPPASPANPHEVVLSITADGFLKQMVRNITGLLVYVGKGKLQPENVRCVVDEGDRCAAPPTAPPQGLTLTRVYY